MGPAGLTAFASVQPITMGLTAAASASMGTATPKAHASAMGDGAAPGVTIALAVGLGPAPQSGPAPPLTSASVRGCGRGPPATTVVPVPKGTAMRPGNVLGVTECQVCPTRSWSWTSVGCATGPPPVWAVTECPSRRRPLTAVVCVMGWTSATGSSQLTTTLRLCTSSGASMTRPTLQQTPQPRPGAGGKQAALSGGSTRALTCLRRRCSSGCCRCRTGSTGLGQPRGSCSPRPPGAGSIGLRTG
mmetsp:Transcript_29556/g.53140  ORF Transcript_29556/g.53140 Transcript_29556/m.53140 type:complete len:245 (-) Transcript_29556:9-743(-)